jgi:cytochrome c-type biogenesis protein CcmH
MKTIIALIFSCIFFAVPSVYAEEGPELVQFDSVEDHKRFQFLLEQLRCLVCQNQSLASSAAGLAGDLRDEVELMVRRGDTNKQIVEFMVDRYGDFVLYDPPLKKSTVILWFAPIILVGIAIVAVVWIVIQRNEKKADSKIDEARRKRAAALLAKKEGDYEEPSQ